jgi:hypothetical protein
VLGSSIPGADVPASNKGVCTLENHGPAGDRTVTLQGPNKALSPTWEQSVGGVSESVGTKAGGSHPFAQASFVSVTVKDIPASRKASLFAG